jgi:serine/threonine-protein kinase
VRLERPEVSAALASVVERATAKDLAQRYADIGQFAADLEDVLAIETSRAGDARGEATSVVRTLPGRARRRLPLRLRHGRRDAILLVALTLLLLVGAAVFVRSRTQRGTGTPPGNPPAKTKPVALAAAAAHDFDPFGTGGEHPELTKLAVDSDDNTEWTTERYIGGLGKPGVGIYLDARPGTKARFLRVSTSTPGFAATVYTADTGPPKDLAGWEKVGGAGSVGRRQDIPVRSKVKRRYWLLWITRLPPGQSQVRIGELTLYR